MRGGRRMCVGWEAHSVADEILSFSCSSRRGCTSSWGLASGDPHQQCGERARPGGPVYPSRRYEERSCWGGGGTGLTISKARWYPRSQFSEPKTHIWSIGRGKEEKTRKMRIKKCLCFHLKHCMHPAPVYMLLNGCGPYKSVPCLLVCGGWQSCFSLPRDVWCAAAEGEWHSHHPAAF